MANDTLLATLRETLQEITEKKSQQDIQLTHLRQHHDDCGAALSRAQKTLERAVHEDEEVKKKMEALRTHLASCTNKPQALQDKFNALSDEQKKTFQVRQRADETVQNCQRQLQTAETDVALAEKECATLEKHWTEVSQQIQEVSANQ